MLYLTSKEIVNATGWGMSRIHAAYNRGNFPRYLRGQYGVEFADYYVSVGGDATVAARLRVLAEDRDKPKPELQEPFDVDAFAESGVLPAGYDPRDAVGLVRAVKEARLARKAIADARAREIENDIAQGKLWPVEAITDVVAEVRKASTLHFGRDWEGRLKGRHDDVPKWFHSAWVDEQERWQATVMDILQVIGRKYAGYASAAAGDSAD